MVEVSTRKQVLDRPISSLVIVLNVDGRSFISIVPPGSFLFKLLWEHDLAIILRFTDAAGTFFGPDYRLWRSVLLIALTVERFPTIHRPFLPRLLTAPAAGVDGQAWGSGTGLDAAALWSSMVDLSDRVPCTKVYPVTLEDVRRGHLTGMDFSQGVDPCLPLCVVFLEAGHWGFLHGVFREGGIDWTFFDGLDFAHCAVARLIVDLLSDFLQTPVMEFRYLQICGQRNTFSCGTIAVLHMAWALGLRG